MRHRLLFCLALLGMLLTAHLHVLKARGFDRGCLGLSDPAPRESPLSLPCREVSESPAGRILGIDVVVPGYLFYAAAALLAHVCASGAPRSRRLAKAALDLALPAALLFSAWLTFVQYHYIKSFCLLCLCSAATVLLMALARLAAADPPAEGEGAAERAARDAAFLSLATVAFVAALAFDLVFVLGAGTGEPRRDAVERITLETIPEIIDRKWLAQMAPCSFRDDEPVREDFRALLPPDVPAKGPAGAPVVLQEFFDPNCPKCAELFRAVETAAAKFGDRVRVEYYPVPLLAKSARGVEAMLAAHEFGMLVPMATLQFSARKEAGLSEAELADLAARLGLPREPFARDLAAGRFAAQASARKEFYRALGKSAVPTLLVNGRTVARSAGALTAECLESLVATILADAAPLPDEE